MVSNQKIDELLKSLDETVDSLESGLNCNDETRKIVRDWLASAQQGVHPTVLPAREIEIICPNCNLVIDVPVPAPHSG